MNIAYLSALKWPISHSLLVGLICISTNAYSSAGVTIRDKGSLTITNPATQGLNPAELSMNCFDITVEEGATLELNGAIINDLGSLIVNSSGTYTVTGNTTIKDCGTFFVIPTTNGNTVIFSL